MKEFLILLTIGSVFVNYIYANPLNETVPMGRTFSQLNMKCNTRSAFKHITMSSAQLGNTRDCVYTIRAYSLKVCQLRIGFEGFNLEQPDPAGTTKKPYAHCIEESLKIDGLDFALCGRFDRRTHIYVPFDVKKLSEEMTITFELKSNSRSTWSLVIDQIECSEKAPIVAPDERQAPEGCLQYYYEPTGYVQSFNYDKVYYGNTRYAICFKRIYQEKTTLELSDIEFEMDGGDFDATCLDANPKPADYIALPFAEVIGATPPYHSLFCGTSIDGEDVEWDGPGPIVIHVNTDEDSTNPEKGFSFDYKLAK